MNNQEKEESLQYLQDRIDEENKLKSFAVVRREGYMTAGMQMKFSEVLMLTQLINECDTRLNNLSEQTRHVKQCS